MKKLICSLMLTAFALALQAGDNKSCCGDKETKFLLCQNKSFRANNG
jgi:hypothetical protein